MKPVNRWSTRLLKKPLLCFSFALLLCTLAYVYQSTNGSQTRSSFAASTPVNIGNRVWLDTNRNGLQDSGESGIANVTVHLYSADGKLNGAAVTDANGDYSFTVSPDATYQLKLDKASDYAAGGPLYGDQLTVANSDCDHVRDSRAALPNASQTISSKNYPQVSVDHLAAGQNNYNFNIGFVQGTDKPLEKKNKWDDGRCPPDYDKPAPTAGAHPIPTVIVSPTPTIEVKKPTPTATPEQPIATPTKTTPTTFPKLPATGSNPAGYLLP